MIQTILFNLGNFFGGTYYRKRTSGFLSLWSYSSTRISAGLPDPRLSQLMAFTRSIHYVDLPLSSDQTLFHIALQPFVILIEPFPRATCKIPAAE